MDRVRSSLAVVTAALLLVAGLYLLHLTGGWGALAVTAAVVALLSAWAWHRHHERDAALPRDRRMRHELWGVTRRVLLVLAVWNGFTFVHYVGHDNGDTVSQRAATWGRDHGFGGVIDYLETKAYSTPPSKTPAKSLTLDVPSTTEAPVVTALPGDTTPSTTAPVGIPQPPAAIAPLISPALPGEGQWVPIARAGGHDTMWATALRPLPEAGGVQATMVLVDQTSLRVGLFNGAEEPGGTWMRGSKVPPELQPALIATMNGGFRFEHIKGGYMTEGVVVKPLKPGDATLGVTRAGKLVLGKLGRDIQDDGSWLSLRQNLELIVDNGQSNVAQGITDGVWWGADFGNKVYVQRSAVCTLKDGRLAYLLVGMVDANQLAQALINVGCTMAMQLDINGTWPAFLTYALGPDGHVVPHFVDQRMGGNPRRYLTGSTKEFFAFFATAGVPPQSVLDR